MWKFRNLPWHERRIYPTLTSFSVLPFLPLLQLLECLNGYMCGHNLIMKFPPDFHNYTGLNRFVNSFPEFTIAPFTIADFRLSLICKKEKNNVMWEVVARRCSAKKLSYKFFKIHREIPVRQSFSNTVKSLQDVRLATLLKKDPLTGVSGLAVCRSSRK